MDAPVYIGPYRVVRRISKGGMGSVHEAVHEPGGPQGAASPTSSSEARVPPADRRVAIKILSPQHAQSAEIVTRFFNEASAPRFR